MNSSRNSYGKARKHGSFKKPSHIQFLLILMLLVCTNSMAQNISIHGKVFSTDGEIIPGANIIQKGTTYGTVTNFDGNNTINNIPSNATLVVSFIGFKPTEIQIQNRNEIDINLIPDVIGLDEVVAIGYGTMRKADLTGSVSTLNEESLIKTAAPNITSCFPHFFATPS